MANFKVFLLTAILGLGATAIAVANQPIYKWKDAKGNIKYTQTKPPYGTPYETINPRISNSDNSNNNRTPVQSSSDSATTTQDEIIAKQEAQKKSVAEQNKEIARKNCTIAKNNLEILENRARVQIEENGKKRFLTDTERAERLEQAKQNVAKFCEDKK